LPPEILSPALVPLSSITLFVLRATPKRPIPFHPIETVGIHLIALYAYVGTVLGVALSFAALWDFIMSHL